MDDATKKPLIFILAVAILLVPSFVVTVRSDMISGAIEITNIIVCEDLTSDLVPVNVVSSSSGFSYGITQVCVAFTYRGSSYFDSCVEWYYEGDLIHNESVYLDGEGVKVFYLLRDDGTPLKKGLYEFYITCKGVRLADISFSIGGSESEIIS
ncbi:MULTISPECIES: hypothetical protein [unclassified Acetomicrobium]|uniref:hypothetical protein n=1 Tax=unclassified Acetomicrobium TaxID=2627317 RepID=UPI001BCE5516|nr:MULTISPECIES: hypothetical protein [Acetomicrobium]